MADSEIESAQKEDQVSEKVMRITEIGEKKRL